MDIGRTVRVVVAEPVENPLPEQPEQPESMTLERAGLEPARVAEPPAPEPACPTETDPAQAR